MKIFTIILSILFMATSAFASLTVPFKCNEEKLIEYFKEDGINLDKSDPNSDGFIEDCGSYYKIHFRERPNDMQRFLEIHMNVERRIHGLEER